MKTIFTVTAAIAILTFVGGCATTSPAVGGLDTDKLVRYECEGKGFSVRAADDFSSVRVRTHEGSVNLDRAESGEFKGDGWTLKTAGGLSLMHKDKVVASNCKKEA